VGAKFYLVTFPEDDNQQTSLKPDSNAQIQMLKPRMMKEEAILAACGFAFQQVVYGSSQEQGYFFILQQQGYYCTETLLGPLHCRRVKGMDGRL
jgi:hypothetical protein